MTEALPKTVKCPYCGRESEPLDMWVYAHWDIELVGTCEGCGREHGLRRGIAYGLQSERKEPKRRKANGSRKER